MIYFSGKDETRRYSLYRPYIHPQVIQIIKSTLQLKKAIGNALDVGCGTGQSTIALTKIAENVTGIDTSEDMISQAQNHEQVKYMHAPAEDIPLPDMTFDMITAGLSFHWFDRNQFLPEAHRLLRFPGWLIIYNYFFSGIMREKAEFKKWLTTEYTSKFPTPPRDRRSLEDEELRQHGFISNGKKNCEADVIFNLSQLVGYITTMTNTVAALKEGEMTLDEVVHWLTSSIEPFFKRRRECAFLFKGYVLFLKKLG